MVLNSYLIIVMVEVLLTDRAGVELPLFNFVLSAPATLLLVLMEER